jgi:hypothetical protein
MGAALAQPPSGVPGQPGATQRASAPRTTAGTRAETRPAWAELTVEQQQALRPLAPGWSTLSEPQKRKWIAMSRNYRTMAPAEQAKLHSRMNEWVALSPQQRTQARLNFAETKGLSADDKKAKWEAYQALTPEEKRKLAAGATTSRTPPTAAAVRPVPPQKFTSVPHGSREAKTPRIAAGPAHDQRPGAPAGQPPAAAPQAN